MFDNRPALALNADFSPLSQFPLSLWNWQEALRAVFLDKATVVAEYEDAEVRSPSVTMRLPSVIALREYVRPPSRVAFTRFNVFLRDGFRCQFCDGDFTRGELTFDHVIPRADGGQTCWENVVAACVPCNFRKGRSYIKPLREPREPTQFELMRAQRRFPPGFLHETWVDFLHWDAVLER